MVRGQRTRRKPSPTRACVPSVRKPPSSPTRSSSPEQSKPSPSPPPRAPWWMEMEPPPPATGDASCWLILDRFVHRSRRRRGVVQGDATASSLAEDCAGRPVRASLRITDPPAVSRLYLHWAGRPQIDRCSVPAAIAAHRNSILFRITVPFEDPMWWYKTGSFPDDYLVYSCSSSSPPSLTVLPPCFHGGDTDTEVDKLFQPYRSQQQRIMFDEEMGILCHGNKGEFTVAHLAHGYHQLELCLLHHPPPASGIPLEMEWNLHQLQIPQDMKINLNTWTSDVVVPIGRCLCWVDYYQGMLLVDVLADNQDQPQLHYIRLPAQALKSRRLYIDAGDPDPFRHVCVTEARVIKLVCIFSKRPPSPPDFTIITWTLVDINQGNWRKDVDNTMRADEFFSLYNTAKSYLPQVVPSFPVVSLVDPDVICFLLKEEGCNLSWMVEVNMRNKVLQSSALYINEEEEEGHPSEKDCRRTFYGHYFIPTKFSSYLKKDAITSRKLSEMMQKAKEGTAMQKTKE